MADHAPNYGTGSPERVAYDLYTELRIHLPDVENEKFADMVGRRLALYEQCLTATKYRRIDTSELK